MPSTGQNQTDWQTAKEWLCHSRRQAQANADIWHQRFHWDTEGHRFWSRFLPVNIACLQ